MATVTPVERRTNVLRHPALPCLKQHYTINLTAGCPFECRYCYAQSFRHNPGLGHVRYYANSLELLRRELPRKRVKPRLVYFSTGCEPFNPHPAILQMLFDAMEMLLQSRVFVLISTKARIPPEFVALLARYRHIVSVEVGLTTVDDSVRSFLEPRASPVKDRLLTLSTLRAAGVPAKAKMDPLIPGLTDTDQSLDAVYGALREVGIQEASASYLYLRRAILERMRGDRFGDWSFDEMVQRTYTGKIKRYCGSGSVRVPSLEYKRSRFAEVKRIAAAHSVKLTLCACKNPGVTTDRCHAQAAPAAEQPSAKTLFPLEEKEGSL